VVGGDEDHRVKEIQTDRHGKVEDLDRAGSQSVVKKWAKKELTLDMDVADTK